MLQIGRAGALLISVLLLSGVIGEPALGQSLAWAKRAGGTNFDQGEGIAVDGAGNSYVTGWFTGSATFGPGEANETTLTSTGADVFVAKYASTGALLWVRQASGPPDTRGEAIAVDGAGNSYVTGVYRFGLTFNGTTLPGFASGDEDMFVAKYDGNGNLVWVRRAGADFIPDVVDVGKHGRGIAVDGMGNSYVTGRFGTELGEDAFFAAKYGANGALLWVRQARNDGVNPSLATGAAIGVDGAGNSYVTGRFAGSITFGPGEANQTTLSSAGVHELFLTKYDSSGALLWARRAGGAGSAVEGEGISVDSAGNSHVTGNFGGSANFGPGETNETTLTSVSVQQDIFVAKYSANGSLLWAKQANGPGNDGGMAISVDSAGNSHVTGGFEASITFGLGEPNETTLTNAIPMFGGPSDIFVAKYASNGALLWAKQASGPKTETGRGIDVDSLGNSYVTGVFGDVSGSAGDPTSVTFGLVEVTETTLTTAPGSGTEVFVAKYKSANQPPVAKCKPVTISAGAGCVAAASVNNDSFDPDGDSITLTQSPPGPYPLGNTAVTLTVTDSSGASSQCAATVTVLDATPPTIMSSVAQSLLWPPNHNLINVGLAVSRTENCTFNSTVQVMVYSNEDDDEQTGDGNHSPDAKDFAPGTLRLRSERKGNGDGRVYLIVVKATDAAGNVGFSCSTVVVSKSQSQANRDAVNTQAAAARAYFRANGAPPPGYFVVGDGPVIGPKQ